jgi:hypothetical protein
MFVLPVEARVDVASNSSSPLGEARAHPERSRMGEGKLIKSNSVKDKLWVGKRMVALKEV